MDGFHLFERVKVVSGQFTGEDGVIQRIILDGENKGIWVEIGYGLHCLQSNQLTHSGRIEIMSEQALSVREAVDHIDGHTFLTVEAARAVCTALDIDFDERLVISWQTTQEAWETYGFMPTVCPGSGVDGLRLSYHVAEKLGIEEPPGRAYIGTGKQAQANKQAIRQKLSELGKL